MLQTYVSYMLYPRSSGREYYSDVQFVPLCQIHRHKYAHAPNPRKRLDRALASPKRDADVPWKHLSCLACLFQFFTAAEPLGAAFGALVPDGSQSLRGPSSTRHRMLGLRDLARPVWRQPWVVVEVGKGTTLPIPGSEIWCRCVCIL